MKGLSLLGKFVFLLNSVAAVALLLGYILPLVPPQSFPVLSVLSLSVPVLIIINAIFFLYWLLQVKKQMLLSLIVLLIGINHVLSLYKFTRSAEETETGALRIMTYNVKQFNVYKWKDDPNVPQKITDFVVEADPDFVNIQEFYRKEAALTSKYKHHYIKYKKESAEFGMAIFSKYPIIDAGSLDFPQFGNNNAIWADVVVKDDTLRIFNVHMQSFRMSPNVEELQKEDSKILLSRMASAFKKQQDQTQLLKDKLEETPHKAIVAGDFNNSAFSYIYSEIRGDRFSDAFKEAGNGFGQTFYNKYFPLRIDYILIDKRMEIDAFKTFKVDHSDHLPLMATFKL